MDIADTAEVDAGTVYNPVSVSSPNAMLGVPTNPGPAYNKLDDAVPNTSILC